MRPASLRQRFGLLGLGGALLGFGLLPLALVLRSAGRASFAEWTQPALWTATLETALLSLAVTGLAVPLGASLAFILERTDVFGQSGRWLKSVLTLPLAIPPYLVAMAWALLGNGKSGLLNRPFLEPLFDLYGRDGMILSLTSSAYPLAFLSVEAALLSADPALEEAARVAGARPATVFRTITLPLLGPALVASAGMIYAFTAAAFGVPYLLGSNAEPPVLVLTTRIFREVSLGGEQAQGRAAIAALVLLGVSVAVQVAIAQWGKGRSVIQVGGKASRPSRVRTGAAARWLAGAVFTFVAIFVVLPVVTIVYTSFLASFGELSRLTLAQWSDVLARAETWRAFGNAALLSFTAALVVAAVGFVLARAEAAGPAGRALTALAELPYVVPGTVLAIGMILAFAQELRLVVLERITFVLALPGTLGLLFLAYVVKHLALGVRSARAALRQLHPSLEEAARVAGASPLRAELDVVLPLLRPAMIAAFVVVALPCLSELTMSVLLFGAGTETAGTLLFELQSYANPPAASVVASLTVLLAIAGGLLLDALGGRQKGEG